MLHAILHLSVSHFVLAHDGHPFGLILYAVPDLPLSYRNRLPMIVFCILGHLHSIPSLYTSQSIDISLHIAVERLRYRPLDANRSIFRGTLHPFLDDLKLDNGPFDTEFALAKD